MINWCHLGDVHFHPRSQFSQGGRMDSVSWPSWQLLMAWSAGGRDFPIDLSWASHGFTCFLSMFVGVSLWIYIYWIEMLIVYSLSIYVDICIVFSLWISGFTWGNPIDTLPQPPSLPLLGLVGKLLAGAGMVFGSPPRICIKNGA